MKLDGTTRDVLSALAEADGSSFTDLVRIARLDPARAFRDADLAHVDFADCDLSGYDFSGADLRGASFRNAWVDDAVFVRADVTDVAWPAGYDPSSMRQGLKEPVLARPFQLAIADAMVSAVSTRPAEPALALLPAGVGRTKIMTEAFRLLMARDVLHGGLVLTDTALDREQLVYRLRSTGLTVETLHKRSMIRSAPPTTIWVSTYARFDRLAKEEVDALNKAVTHVVLAGLTSRLQRIESDLKIWKSSRVMAFAGLEVLLPEIDGVRGRVGGLLGRSFPEATCVYGIDQAIEEGVLAASEIVGRHFASAHGPGSREEHELERDVSMMAIARDFAQEVLERDAAGSSLLVARRIASVEALADHVQTVLDSAHEGGRSPLRVVPLGSRRKGTPPLPHLLSEDRTVVIATTSYLAGADLGAAALIGIATTGLSDQLVARLTYPRATRGRLRVIDYGGALSRDHRPVSAI